MRLLSCWRQLSRRPERLTRTASTNPEGVGDPEAEEGPEPPNGFLFNEKPLLPGEKRVKEWWENLYAYGMSFNFLLVIGVVLFKPDTSMSSWAREKALERLAAAEGEAVSVNQLPVDDNTDSDS